MCPKKTDDETEKNKKAGHTHVTTDNILKYNKNNQDKDYGDWGSVSLGDFMFHQHDKPSTRSYQDALLEPTPKTGGPTKQITCCNNRV
eukprot:7755832-Ditylum_brightwellii.AAC.1